MDIACSSTAGGLSFRDVWVVQMLLPLLFPITALLHVLVGMALTALARRRLPPTGLLVRLGWRPRCLPVSAPQVRRRCHSGRHGRRRVAGCSLSALISLRNGWRGERDVALHRAARCSAAVCLLLADCSPVVLCHPQVGRPRRLQRGSETQGLLPRSFGSDRRATPDLGASVVPVYTRWVPVLGRAAHA